MTENLATIVLANGCFWCTEAIFRRLRGVHAVIPGFSGGKLANPSTDKVSMGTTGHAEALQIAYDPSVITYETLLEVFWNTHNPTTLNQQGYDKGPQYRSVIFTNDAEQTAIAEKSREAFARSGAYSDPIVTEIVPFTQFYPAEKYHQDFYENNPEAPYCNFIIAPKIKKLLSNYREQVKPEYLD